MLILFSLVALVFATPDSFREWGDWRASGRGTVLNPPRGNVDDDVRRTVALIESMLKTLGGARLNEYQVAVSILAQDAPNAFITRYAGAAEMRAFEDAAKTARRQGRRLRARRLPSLATEVVSDLGFDPERTVYQMGFSTGLLRQLGTDAELAFVVSHEATHLFEGHLEAMVDRKVSERFKRWWDSQRYEVIADDGAVVGLVSHYALRGGVDALNRLARDGSGKDYLLRALTSSHHHEGMRIASVQGRTEHLLLTNPAALDPAARTLPAHVKLRRSGRTSHVRDETHQRAFLLGLARDYPRSVDDLQSLLGKAEAKSRKWEEYTSVRLAPRQYARIVTEVLQILADPARAWTGRERVDAFLILLRIIGENCPDQSYWAHLSEAEVQRMIYVLARFTTGPHAWDISSQIRFYGARDLPHPAKSLFDIFTTRQNASRVLVRLFERNSTWREGVRVLVRARLEEPSEFLGSLAKGGSYYEMTTSALELLRREALEEIASSAALDRLVTAMHTDWKRPQFSFGRLITDLKGDEDETPASLQFIEDVVGRLHGKVDAFAGYRDATLIEALRTETVPGNVFSLLNSALVTERFVPFGPALREQLHANLMDHVARDEARPYNSPRPLELIDLVTRDWSAFQTPNILRFLAVRLDHTIDNLKAHADHARRAEVLDRVGAMWRNLPLADIVNRTREPSAVVRDLVAKYFRSHHRRTGSFEALADYAASLAGEVPKGFDDHFLVKDALRTERDERSAALVWANQIPALYAHLERNLSRPQLIALMSNLRHAVDVHQKFGKHFEILRSTSEFRVSAEAGEAAVRLLIAREAEFRDPGEWRVLLDDVYVLNPFALARRAEYRPRLAELTEQRLAHVRSEELMTWVEAPGVLAILDPHRAAELVVSALDAGLDRHAPHAVVARTVSEVVAKLALDKEFPEVFQIFRERWAQHRRQQPNLPYLTEREGTATERTRDLSSHVRGLSAMITMVREGNFDEQIDAIDYLMGRLEQPPRYIADLRVETEVLSGLSSSVPLQGLLSNARERLRRESVVVRTMVANSFLAGPHGVIATPKGVDQLLARILSRFRPDVREFAEVIARATIHAQDNSASLAFAYCLAQVQGDGEDPLNFEARMLNSLFSSFGVPGTKYAQYIAFSPDLAAYRTALEDTQDAAMPIGYHEAIRLLEKRFGTEWTGRYEVVGLEGSGAVNIALTVRDTQTGEDLILNVLRDEIRTASRYHFHKFRRALAYVLEDARFKDRFAYLGALSRIIEASVDLEFDKPRVAAMHDYLKPLYQRRRHGWNVDAPAVREVGHDAIVMTKAPGLSARKVWTRDPALYKSAMRAFAEVEFEALRGTLGQESWATNDLHANPDVHDGQVYIDAATRTLTVLDPGQTVMITTLERDLARDLLTFLTGLSTPEVAARLIDETFLRGTGRAIDPALLATRRNPDDPLGSFMRILGDIEALGGAVPLPILHWIIASHRLVQLGRKIDVDYRVRLGLDLRARQRDLPARLVNFGFGIERAFAACARRLAGD